MLLADGVVNAGDTELQNGKVTFRRVGRNLAVSILFQAVIHKPVTAHEVFADAAVRQS